MKDRISCSIGVICYNEEQNIAQLLESLLNQKLETAEILKIVVVSSDCSDNTDDIVLNFCKEFPKMELIQQPCREGKASAINLFLKEAEGDICVIESGDTIPYPNTIENLILPFCNDDVGMVGVRPIPVNSRDTFLGYVVHLLWKLHHRIAMEKPKLGEMVAFRNIVEEIPVESAVDEASIEAIIRKANYKLYYDGNALVKNKGAETITDFLKQRRRIYAGHLWLCKTQDYEVSTNNPFSIFKHLLHVMEWSPKKILWSIGAIALEAWGRFLGMWDFYIKKKNPYKWEISESTKNLCQPES